MLTCEQRGGHVYDQLATPNGTDPLIIFCHECGDVKRIPLQLADRPVSEVDLNWNAKPELKTDPASSPEEQTLVLSPEGAVLRTRTADGIEDTPLETIRVRAEAGSPE